MPVPSATERLLVIMGSGETTPTMVKLHRQLFDRLGPPPGVRAVLLDTPYGFQSNASDISARAVAYFRESIGRDVTVASLRRGEDGGSLELESALAHVGEAQWVFAGPGSPTYALRQWRPTSMPSLLASKLSAGGCIVFASAAALTLGHWTVPVYEIYKAGMDPGWDTGLGLLEALGLRVAVIPHYDNAEGGNHDTRFCYLGEERLRLLEGSLPDDGWVLGVDEHTALVLDLGAGMASVYGRGGVTLRHKGVSVVLGAGQESPIGRLAELALSGRGTSAAVPAGTAVAGQASGGSMPVQVGTDGAGGEEGGQDGKKDRRDGASGLSAGRAVSPLAEETARLRAAFDKALDERDSKGATEAVLAMEELVHGWAADTFESEDMDRARAELRRMLLRLGDAAGPGLADPRDALTPFVEALLVERAEARAGRRFGDADRIRGTLAAAGVEVRDTPDGPEWYLG